MTCDGGQEWLGTSAFTVMKDKDNKDKYDRDKYDQTEDNREMSDKLPDCSYDQ